VGKKRFDVKSIAHDDDFAEVRRAINADTPQAANFHDLATQLQLPQAQREQVVGQVMQAGTLGPQIGAAVRASLANLKQPDGNPFTAPCSGYVDPRWESSDGVGAGGSVGRPRSVAQRSRLCPVDGSAGERGDDARAALLR